MNYCGFILTPLLFWYPNALYTIGYPHAGTICIVSRGFLDYVLNCSLSVCQILRWNIVCTGTWFRLLLPAELAATCLFPVLGDWCGPSNLLTSAGPRFDLVLDLVRNRVYTLVANSISIWFWSRVCHADLRWKPYLNDAFFINGEPWCAMLFWCQKHNHNSYDELLQRMVSEIACAIGIWDEERCSWFSKKPIQRLNTSIAVCQWDCQPKQRQIMICLIRWSRCAIGENQLQGLLQGPTLRQCAMLFWIKTEDLQGLKRLGVPAILVIP